MTFYIHKCRVEIGFLFIATVAFLLIADRSGIGIIGLLAAVIHECGHLILMNSLSVPPVKVKFNVFGIDIVESSRNNRSYLKDALIAIAGPCLNGIAYLILIGLNTFFPYAFISTFAAVNGVLALFNVLPIEALDGGQALYSLLCMKCNQQTATKIVEVVSFLVLLPLAFIGFMILIQSRYNFTLLLASIYLMSLMLLKRGRYF